MLKNYVEERYAAFLREMDGIIEENPDGFDRLAAIILCVRKYLKELRDHIVQYGFKDDTEEIYCFKEAKPNFLSWYIYHTEWYHIMQRVPAGSAEVTNAYFLDEIRSIDRYLDQIGFFRRYYDAKATELDSLCFIRGKSMDTLLMPELVEYDPEFSTYADHTFAKIIAYERLRDALMEEVRLPDLGVKGIDLRWTGDACNLVELIYGIYDTGQINHGKAELQDIVTWLEDALKVNLSRFYRRFTEIKERKIISPTKYLDSMRDAILRRIDDDLKLKPKKKYFPE
ncbi:MAG TPA: RteC domain-containing protein [Mucilaginibacter sp.]